MERLAANAATKVMIISMLMRVTAASMELVIIIFVYLEIIITDAQLLHRYSQIFFFFYFLVILFQQVGREGHVGNTAPAIINRVVIVITAAATAATTTTTIDEKTILINPIR